MIILVLLCTLSLDVGGIIILIHCYDVILVLCILERHHPLVHLLASSLNDSLDESSSKVVFSDMMLFMSTSRVEAICTVYISSTWL